METKDICFCTEIFIDGWFLVLEISRGGGEGGTLYSPMVTKTKKPMGNIVKDFPDMSKATKMLAYFLSFPK